MNIISLPNILRNPVYVKGLNQPLQDVAEILDEQGKHEHALALRYAAIICDTFAEVNLNKNAEIK